MKHNAVRMNSNNEYVMMKAPKNIALSIIIQILKQM